MHLQYETRASIKPTHSDDSVSVWLPCSVRSMHPRRVTQRGRKTPYFCIMADSSTVRAFNWGARTVSETSGEFLGFVLLFLETVWSHLLSDLHTHANASKQWHTTAGDGRIKHDCMQIRSMFVKINVFMRKKKCTPVSYIQILHIHIL